MDEEQRCDEHPGPGSDLLPLAARARKRRSAYRVARAQLLPASWGRGPGTTSERDTPLQARAAHSLQGGYQLGPSMRRILLVACAIALAVALAASRQQPTR